jgi:GNAT superfamily N-acetyltransferase
VAPEADGPQYLLERLAAHHSVSEFRCQAVVLDQYLQNNALADQTNDLARTYVLVDPDAVPRLAVAGYFTLKAESYYMPDGQPTVPVVELAWLARHQRLRGQGIGPILLLQALSIVERVAEFIGVAGVQLAPTREGRRLYERFRFGAHQYGGDQMFLPMARVRQVVREYTSPDE